ncbi:Histidine protein kinase DivJ [Salinivirga cyanobacteriivorans]|uniref:histidine kinase n=1 Tax=Salinivirga cyanobacteriivorans TaxID=1307839 RepID=A0A0S2HXC0_9BACT|nr:PAS domain S-box protein [Salinivirga cyanobacteriivorans]ALO14686.1 Histidine protein kinase DivJ [Salinivirga cyanobacteriivorans]
MREKLNEILKQYSKERNSPLYKTIEEFAQTVPGNGDSITQIDYKGVFSESKTIGLLIDPATGNILDANDGALNYYGYSAREMLSMKISEINILTEDEIAAEIHKAKTQKRNYFLFRHRLKNGEIRNVEVYSHPVNTKTGIILHSVIFDIEEKVKARYEANRFHTAVEQSPTSVVITDLDGTIEYVNPKFTELTGYTVEEAIGENPRILKSEKTSPEVYKEMWETISNGKVWVGEFINKHKNGTHFWERATLAPLYQDSLHVGYIAVKENITDRKIEEFKVAELNHELEVNLEELNSAYEELNVINEKLNESNEILKTEREQFLSLLNSITEPIYVADKYTYEILFANQAVNEVVGHNISGEKCFRALQNNDEPCSFCKHDEIFTKNKSCYWEHFNESLKKDFYIIDRPIRWVDGREAHFQLAIDVSKLKEVEKELRQAKQDLTNRSKELEELNATKDKFFSIISHDLKNPFNAIMGFSNFLYTKIDKYDKETIKQYAGNIYKSSRNSYKLLQNLLEWAGSQMNHTKFDPVPFKLYQLVDECITGLYSQISEKNIHADVQVPAELDAYGDKNMINTILRNLISNAIKFSHKGGKIVIDAMQKNKCIVISVKDFGVGMPNETQKKLFKISEKVTTPGTNQEKGTGLGLLLSKEFATKHGGKIKVQSQEGEGSEFFVYLPLP